MTIVRFGDPVWDRNLPAKHDNSSLAGPNTYKLTLLHNMLDKILKASDRFLLCGAHILCNIINALGTLQKTDEMYAFFYHAGNPTIFV